VFLFTHTESGLTGLSGVHRLASGQDAQAIGDAAAVTWEESQREAEADIWWEYLTRTGDSPEDEFGTPPKFRTIPLMRRQMFRWIINLLRADRRGEADEGAALANCEAYFTSFSNVYINNQIQAGAWTPAKIGDVKTRLAAFKAEYGLLDHGEPEIE
jgi:hypothetical protein